ncbi:MAG: VIT1/CCC1 transporter family protein [Candidatus Omnitrophica bacterium]|nr:VIT1/CCC1 transporter family protein [Candidatus Omnitrophota bacterium]
MSDFVRSKIRDAVFGTQDGLVSTLGALIGIAVGTQHQATVAIAGCVIVAVESLSMAAGSYLSSKSQRQYLERLLADEWKAITQHPEQEHEELLQMYRARGFTDEEIAIIARRLFADKRWLLEDMAHKELGISPARLEEPVSNAVAMGISYLVGGVIPVAPYLFWPMAVAIPASIAATAATLFLLGAGKGRLVRQPWWAGGLEMLGVAGAAALIGYVVGAWARAALP